MNNEEKHSHHLNLIKIEFTPLPDCNIFPFLKTYTISDYNIVDVVELKSNHVPSLLFPALSLLRPLISVHQFAALKSTE